VLVVETREAKRKTADLGELLARSQGTGVRRGGGLGSGTRFSLAGLTDARRTPPGARADIACGARSTSP
jgi:hypothetical protein